MTDLRGRFADLRDEIERLTVPDLTPRPPTGGPVGPGGPAVRRLATVALALVVAAASTLLLVRAFRADDRPPAIDSEPTTFDPRVAFTVPVGPRGQTNAIAAAGGSIWVTAYGVEGGAGPDRSAVLQLYPASGQVVRTIPIEATNSWEVGGYGIAVGFDSVWIAGGSTLGGGSQTALVRVDAQTGDVLATIPLGGSGGAADVDVNDEGVWVTLRAGDADELVLVDPATNAVADRIPLPERYARKVIATDSMVIAEELVWSGNRGPCSELTSIDPQTHAVMARSEPFPGPCSLTRLIEWRDQAWGTTADDRFVPIDPATALPGDSGYPFEHGHGPRSFLLPSETGIWYAAYPGENGEPPDRLTRIDPATGERTTYPLDVGAIAAVMDGDSIWTLSFDGEVTRIDLNPH
jgi:streptogramin lyase